MNKEISYKNLLSLYHNRTDNYIKRPVVCIQGLGFVGSAMSAAVSIAKSNNSNCFNVIGVDLDNELGNERINSINQGVFPFNTNDEFLKQSLYNAYLNQNVVATSNEKAFSLANIIVIDIHLDINFLDDKPLLDFKRLKNAIATIASQIKKEALVIVETTVPPGTSEKIILPTFEKELFKRDMTLNDINIAHSYERVMPGDNYLDSIINYWRVYSGMNERSASLCESFLSKLINIKEYPLSKLSSMTASETAKVLENTYRASNIAFIDEWTKFAELVGINLFEIIDAIKKRPTHNNIMKPGLGVGGYCLTKDSSFAPASLEQLFNHQDHQFPFSSLSNKVNNDMPLHVFNRTKSSLNQNLKGKRILILGVAYRENVGDTRFSPCELYARNCIADGAIIDYLDPYVEYWSEMEMHSQIEPIDYINYDLLLIAVPHKEFIEFDYNQIAKYSNLIIIDAANLLKEDQIIRKEFKCKVLKIGNGINYE